MGKCVLDWMLLVRPGTFAQVWVHPCTQGTLCTVMHTYYKGNRANIMHACTTGPLCTTIDSLKFLSEGDLCWSDRLWTLPLPLNPCHPESLQMELGVSAAADDSGFMSIHVTCCCRPRPTAWHPQNCLHWLLEARQARGSCGTTLGNPSKALAGTRKSGTSLNASRLWAKWRFFVANSEEFEGTTVFSDIPGCALLFPCFKHYWTFKDLYIHILYIYIDLSIIPCILALKYCQPPRSKSSGGWPWVGRP